MDDDGFGQRIPVHLVYHSRSRLATTTSPPAILPLPSLTLLFILFMLLFSTLGGHYGVIVCCTTAVEKIRNRKTWAMIRMQRAVTESISFDAIYFRGLIQRNLYQQGYSRKTRPLKGDRFLSVCVAFLKPL